MDFRRENGVFQGKLQKNMERQSICSANWIEVFQELPKTQARQSMISRQDIGCMGTSIACRVETMQQMPNTLVRQSMDSSWQNGGPEGTWHVSNTEQMQ